MIPNPLRLASLIAFAAIFVACSGSGPQYNPDIGPFDEDGNYVEAWADNPPKSRRKTSSRTKKSRTSKAKKERTDRWNSPKTQKKPEPVAKTPPPARKARPAPKPQPKATPKPKAKPKPKARPKPKAKPKPKPKPVRVTPQYTRHRVTKGDTLFSLAKKYRTSIPTLRRLNNLSGNTIRLGQTILIPKS